METTTRRALVSARIASTWAPGLCGAPDVRSVRTVSKIADNGVSSGGEGGRGCGGNGVSILDNGHQVVIEETTKFNKQQTTQKTQNQTPSNNGDSTNQTLDNGAQEGGQAVDKAEDITTKSMREPVRVTFKMPSDGQLDNKNNCSQKVDLAWEALLWRGDLFLNIPDGIVIEHSKEAFISLLEFGEELLKCNSIVVCFAKSRPERNVLMRMFMFLGFVTLTPNHPMVPQNADEDTIYMAYSINN